MDLAVEIQGYKKLQKTVSQHRKINAFSRIANCASELAGLSF